MERLRHVARLALGASLGVMVGLGAGCGARFRPEPDFDTAVRRWVPIGSSAAEVSTAMQSRGFTIWERSGGSGDADASEPVVVSRTEPTGFSCETEWRAIFRLDEGRVAEIETFVFLTAP